MERQSSEPNSDVERPAGDGGLYTITQRQLRVRDLPVSQMPREELDRLGVEHAPDTVLLAILLRGNVKGLNVLDLAQALLRAYPTWTAMGEASVEELLGRRFRGFGRVKAQVLAAALEIARRYNAETAPQKRRVRTPADVAAIVRDEVRRLDCETFWALLLDAKNGLIGHPVVVSKGLLDASLVHPREVFKEAIRRGAAAMVLAHNHPSGDPSPSAEDVRITRQLVESGRVVDIRVLDHVILGKPGNAESPPLLSLRESGVVTFST
jgi:DNA repair protein RadC